MKHSVLVIGHADADGHLIAEQTRRNLSLIGTFDVTALVDPNRTKDHRAWLRLDEITEIEDADIVFFVDMMIAPSTFVEEAAALVQFVNKRRDKLFFLIDHHPLPLRRLAEADNLRVAYRPEVFDCVIGPRSGMMIVAALCEGQKQDVSEIRSPIHDRITRGMKRAAAIGGSLPGNKLLALLRADCWVEIAELGDEPNELHKMPRGRRAANQPLSKALRLLERVASKLLEQLSNGASNSRKLDQGRTAMSYDADVGAERFAEDAGKRVRVRNTPVQARDLEVILTLMEIAALSLTPHPGAMFSRNDLLNEIRKIAGGDVDVHEDDINVVLTKQGFLKRIGKELCLR